LVDKRELQEQFHEQGGAATMDPGPFVRWLTSRLLTRWSDPARLEKRRSAQEKKRLRESSPHRVEYFHQLEDGYSHLAAQVLQALVARYDIELHCHLVSGPAGKNVPEPELLLQLSRYDAFHVAPEYGLEFPSHPQTPNPALVQQGLAILAAQETGGFVSSVAAVGRALWRGDAAAMGSLAAELGSASNEQVTRKVALGSKRRAELKHYSGAMFHYGGEWYWGVDRLYHLEKRLAALGADRRPDQPLIVPRPAVEAGELRDSGTLTLEVYASLRSPYTAIALDRAVQLAGDTGVKLVVRPVLPMVMRGVPATREKGLYIFMDAAREAREAGVPYGNFYDPIGEPVRRCYSLYPWAAEQGRGVELLASFLRHAFVEGVNTNKERGLRQVVEAADLQWSGAKQHLGEPGWEIILEENRRAMYEAGLWGVPSFRLLNRGGEQVLALWGQDRLWLVAREVQRQLETGGRRPG
jgi:2-hydroxychromene-2-carboxylate isomerase